MPALARAAVATTLTLITAAAVAHAQSATPLADDARGPVEVRDEQVLAQPRLTLPPVSPATVPPGQWSFEVATLWSSTFSWIQDVPGETPNERTFLLDAETHTYDLTLRRGLAADLDVALRVPLRWRGGGAMDGLIDWWHRVFGFPDSGRPYFVRNAFRVEGVRSDGGVFSWNDEAGSGLGDLELAARWRFVEPPTTRDGPSLALVVRASLPTGTGPFAGNGPAVGAQLVLRQPLARSVDVYAGVGGTAQGRGPVRGVAYEPARAHGFVAFEWRPWRSFSLVAETNLASRLVANIESYPGADWLLDVSGRVRLGRRTRLDLGFTEGLVDQLSTTDFALFAGVAVRP